MKKTLMFLAIFLLVQPYTVGSFANQDLPGYMPQESMDDVLELRLKAKDLVEQFVEGNTSIFQNKTILLTDIVNINNFKEESSLGKVFTEELYNEFVKRGISVREYRISKSITASNNSGNSFLSGRDQNVLIQNNELVMVGTYNITKDTVTLNARILEPNSGLVQKTASIFFKKTKYITNLSKRNHKELRTIEVKAPQKKNTQQQIMPTRVFDRGIH